MTGFDDWEKIRSNPRLPIVLADLSTTNPATTQDGDPLSQQWTLDALFLLPRARLKYYKKLYSRLLKSTKPGRSDHKLLLSATETLDTLYQLVESRIDIRVGSGAAADVAGRASQDAPRTEDVNLDALAAQMRQLEQELAPRPPAVDPDGARDSVGSSGPSNVSSG